MTFATDRMKGSERTNAINSQLDVLYAFCQYELARQHPGELWFELYRGTCDPDDYHAVRIIDRRERIVRLNNLCSFIRMRNEPLSSAPPSGGCECAGEGLLLQPPAAREHPQGRRRVPGLLAATTGCARSCEATRR